MANFKPMKLLGRADAFRWTYLTMLGGLPILTLLFATFAGNALHMEDMMAVLLLGMGLINMIGAWIVVRPLSLQAIQGGHGTNAARRLRALPRLSAIWVFVLILGSMGSHHFLQHGGNSGDEYHHVASLYYSLLLIGIYGVLMGLFYYFAIGSLVFAVRRRVEWLPESTWRPSAKLSNRLAVAILATVTVPLALSLAHREITASVPAMHAQDLDILLTLDMAAAIMIVGAAIVFFSQSITKPVEHLLGVMKCIQSGELKTRARLMTDDEIGVLSQGLNSMAEELEEREFLHQQLGRFVPESVATAVREDRGVIRPRESEATMLYSDVEGFTGLCQKLHPHQIFDMLNEYFSLLSACIREHGGVITQFQGDAILATFNLPVPLSDHGLRGVKAALDIQNLLSKRKFSGDVSLPTRIGVNTGLVVAGTVGDISRLGYTVHGDAVNFAQRLEEANKITGTRILVSARTAELVGNSLRLELLGDVKVPGRKESIRVFTPPTLPDQCASLRM